MSFKNFLIADTISRLSRLENVYIVHLDYNCKSYVSKRSFDWAKFIYEYRNTSSLITLTITVNPQEVGIIVSF